MQVGAIEQRKPLFQVKFRSSADKLWTSAFAPQHRRSACCLGSEDQYLFTRGRSCSAGVMKVGAIGHYDTTSQEASQTWQLLSILI